MEEAIVVKCIDYFLSILEVFFLFRFSKVHLQHKDRCILVRKILLTILGGTFIYWLGKYYMPPIKILYVTIAFILFNLVCFKGNILKHTLVATSYTLLVALTDYITLLNGVYVLDIEAIKSLEHSWVWLELAAFSKVILFIIIIIINRFKDKDFKDMPFKIWLLTGSICVGALSSIMILVKLTDLVVEGSVKKFLVAIVIFILSAIIVIYIMMIEINRGVIEKKDYEVLSYKNEILMEQIKSYESSEQDVRKIWHDFNNHISCLDMLLEMNSIQKARDYIIKLKTTSSKRSHKKKVIQTGNMIADIVINQKYHEAKEKNIAFTYEGKLQEDMPISEIHLCALLSNSLDNAIEACEKLALHQEKKIHIVVDYYKEVLQTNIKNTADQIKIKKGRLITTKQDSKNHGIGTKNMQQIAEQYAGVMNWNYKDNIFALYVLLDLGTAKKRISY